MPPTVRIHAPELPTDAVWIGVEAERPPTLKALRGRVVILEFWTSC